MSCESSLGDLVVPSLQNLEEANLADGPQVTHSCNPTRLFRLHRTMRGGDRRGERVITQFHLESWREISRQPQEQVVHNKASLALIFSVGDL